MFDEFLSLSEAMKTFEAEQERAARRERSKKQRNKARQRAREEAKTAKLWEGDFTCPECGEQKFGLRQWVKQGDSYVCLTCYRKKG